MRFTGAQMGCLWGIIACGLYFPNINFGPKHLGVLATCTYIGGYMVAGEGGTLMLRCQKRVVIVGQFLIPERICPGPGIPIWKEIGVDSHSYSSS